MRLGMELEFDKYCVVDGSPTTVLPVPRQHSKVERRRSKGHHRYPNDVSNLKEDAAIRNFQRYRSVSCNTNSSRKAPQEHDEMHKRGSVYQSSKEVRLMRKTEATQGRKKIEIPGDSDTLSFGIVDSLCSSDEDKSRGEHRRYSVVSPNSDLSTETTCKSHMEINPQDLLDLSSCSIQSIPRRSIPLPKVNRISCDTNGGRNRGAKEGEFQPFKNMNGSNKPVKVCSTDVRVLYDNSVVSLPKSLSAKLTLPHSPARSESESSRTSSPRGRFDPVREVLDPFVKSKLQKSPMSSSSEQQSDTPSSATSFSWNKTFRKSLLHDFSNIRQPAQSDESPAKEYYHQPVLNSPAHLQGLLKLDQKHGVPFFEFSVKVTEDFYTARTWKENSSSDWMYTFHSAHDVRKSNASGRGSKDSYKVSSLVGQMQVSCYLCTELKDAGASDTSMVSEFVMHDVSNLRKSISSQHNSSSCLGVGKTFKASDENSAQVIRTVDDEVCYQDKGQKMCARHSGRADSLYRRPLAATDLLAHSEAATIVVQVPLERRESLKCKNGEGNIVESLPSLLGDLDLQSSEEHFADCAIANINAVIPCGTHSLPTTESRGPSSLLDRWRLGGGCDCGGWDLACPLNVLGNSNIKIAKDHILMENKQTWDLFIQGRKDNTPALRMTRTEEGQYAVDFHAQLSTLQAFSICVAVLRATDTSLGFSHEQRAGLLQRNSLEAFTKLEIENLVDAVAATKKTRVSKNIKRSLPSFIVNPPFSPIARV